MSQTSAERRACVGRGLHSLFEHLPLIFSAFDAGLSVVRLKILLQNTMFDSSGQATQAHGGQQLFIRVPDVGHVKALRFITW